MYYRKSLENTVAYIEAHLNEPFTLGDLCRVNGFSQHHFSKLFHLFTGYTISSYIRNRRLSEAGSMLINSHDRIIDIAMSCHFSSQASFTKAFTKAYGLSPSRYRKLNEHHPIIDPLEISKIVYEQNGIEIKPEIVILESFHVIGLSCRSKNENGEIKRLWHDFIKSMDQIENRVSNETYGICEQLEGELDFDDLDEFSYLAGLKVDSDDAITGMDIWHIPHQKYAVFTHHGSTELLGDTYKAIYLDWLPESGYELAVGYDFEMYDHRFVGDVEASKMFVYIPIK